MLYLGLAMFGCLLLATAINAGLRQPGEVPEATTVRAILISALCLHLMTFPAVHLFLLLERRTWVEAFGFDTPRSSRAVLLAVGVTVVALPVTWFLNELSGRVIHFLGQEPVVQSAVTVVQTSEGLLTHMELAFVAILLAPAAEEVLFRGILYPFLKQWGRPRTALWITALLFGAVHLNLMTFAPLVFLGAALGWLYERTGNLLASILATNSSRFFI